MNKRTAKSPRKAALSKEFDVNVLDKLVEDENSCVEVHELTHHLALHPFHLNDLSNSLKQILNQGICKYNSKFDGILFGYKNMTLCSDMGAIFDDSCFIHVDVKADFFIFKPVVGKVLQGVVNKLSEDHVGCLVHDLFNVSLPNLKHSEDWIGNSCTLDNKLSFEITFTDFDRKLPYIRGNIISILSNPNSKTEDIPIKQNKKKRKIEPTEEDDVNESTHRRKKTKRIKEEVMDSIECSSSDKKRKRKIKQEAMSDQ